MPPLRSMPERTNFPHLSRGNPHFGGLSWTIAFALARHRASAGDLSASRRAERRDYQASLKKNSATNALHGFWRIFFRTVHLQDLPLMEDRDAIAQGQSFGRIVGNYYHCRGKAAPEQGQLRAFLISGRKGASRCPSGSSRRPRPSACAERAALPSARPAAARLRTTRPAERSSKCSMRRQRTTSRTAASSRLWKARKSFSPKNPKPCNRSPKPKLSAHSCSETGRAVWNTIATSRCDAGIFIHHDPAYANRAGRRRLQARDEPQRRRLAAPGRSDQAPNHSPEATVKSQSTRRVDTVAIDLADPRKCDRRAMPSPA